MHQLILDYLNQKNIPQLSFFLKPEILTQIPSTLNQLRMEEMDYIRTLETKIQSQSNLSEFFKNYSAEELRKILAKPYQQSSLDYLRSILSHLNSTGLSEDIRPILETFRPRYQELKNTFAYSNPYYKLLSLASKLPYRNSDQQRIFTLRLKDFHERGINLPPDVQNQLKNLNLQAAKLSEKIQNNVVDAQKAFTFTTEDNQDFAQVPKNILEKARKNADKNGMLTFDSDPSTLSNLITYCKNPQIRQHLYHQKLQRASHPPYDNRENILAYLHIKKQQATLLNHPHYASLVLEKSMAESPKQIKDLVESIFEKALPKAKTEIEELKTHYQLENLPPSDISYRSTKYEEEQFYFNQEEIRDYFEFEHVTHRLFNFSTDFFGLQFKEITRDHEGIRYEVYHNENLISYFLLDAFYRPGKRPGAWANILREKQQNQLPIIINVCNFQKNETGPSLLYLRDVETLFHEFGHAIHTMLSQSLYPELNGFFVERDFIELPSQLMENRVSDPQSLKSLARHYQTNAPLSEKQITALQKSKKYMSANHITRQNEFAILDMTLYTEQIPDTIKALDELILKIVNSYSPFPRGEEYKIYCSFLHIFGGSYEAGYYSYMRAEILEADVFSKIKENGIFNHRIGHHYVKTILMPGARKPAKELFEDFMQRIPSHTAFLQRYKLTSDNINTK